MAKPGIHIQNALAGQVIPLGGATLEILFPTPADAARPPPMDDVNNTSVVVLLRYGGFRALLAGDAEAPVEQLLADRGVLSPVDVLKVGHHGSDSGTTPAFLAAVAPSVAIISVGMDNDYGHPHRSTLDHLAAVPGLALFRTDLDGTVEVETDGWTYRVHTDRDTGTGPLRVRTPRGAGPGTIAAWPCPTPTTSMAPSCWPTATTATGSTGRWPSSLTGWARPIGSSSPRSGLRRSRSSSARRSRPHRSGLFGSHCVVLRQPLRAAGTSAAAAERLVALVEQLPPGAILALAEQRSSRDVTRPPALLKRLETAVLGVGGTVIPCPAPRRDELRGWVTQHAAELGIVIRPAAAALLAERMGGVWENDVERGEQTRMADTELRKLATAAGDEPIEPALVEALVPDSKPPSVNAVGNAIEKREPAKASEALRRALAEGEPVLRIMAALEGRIVDLVTARDLVSRGATQAEIMRRVRPGNPSAAERVVGAARRYSGSELEAMLNGLFEADLAIKSNAAEPEAALTAWLGTYVLGMPAATGSRSG